MNAILTLSFDTTPAQVDMMRSGVLCPIANHFVFLVKSIFTSKIILHPTCLYHADAVDFLSRIENATEIFPFILIYYSTKKYCGSPNQDDEPLSLFWVLDVVFYTRPFSPDDLTDNVIPSLEYTEPIF